MKKHDLVKAPVSRRSFLKGSAGAALAFPTIVPASVFGASSPSNQLRIGCIGTGRMGHGDMSQALSQGLKSDLNARVVAVCDVNLHRAQDARKKVLDTYAKKDIKTKVDIYQDFRELLERSDIDGVTISTPDHQHAVNAVAAAKAGKDIYLQKPLTYSVNEGKALVNAVRENKVVLQTGSQQRSSLYFRRACELVRNKAIGELQCVEVVVNTDSGTGSEKPMPIPEHLNYDLWLGPRAEAPYTEDRVQPQKGYSRPGWLQIEDYCLGMITGWGAHMYDIAHWAMGIDHDGGPVDIEARADFPKRGLFDVHTDYQAWATYANGVKMRSHTGKPGVNFTGSDGWIWISRNGFMASDRSLFRKEPGPNDEHLYISKNHMADFLQCMRTRKDPICPVEVGHRSNTVCILHHIAMKLKQKLKWDPKAERFVDNEKANKMLDFEHRQGWEV